MKQVIFINDQNKQDEKPVEFTHVLSSLSGWQRGVYCPSDYKKVVYLGKCSHDGDMFNVYNDKDQIIIFKGHLNSGKY